VAPGSPGEVAGIRPGDTLLGVNDTGFNTVPPAADAPASQAGVAGARELLDRALSAGPAVLLLSRGGKEFQVRLTAVAGCAYRFQLHPSSTREASSDGRTISVSTALTRYAVRDEDLAVILGHEMAHNVLGHVQHPTGSARGRERQADYVGLYLAARAGYDISGASGFWKAFGADDWRARWGFLTHPSPSARSRALAAATAEIQAKQAAGQPLLPASSPPR
jgi:Zn-dependent protease with chaperone function